MIRSNPLGTFTLLVALGVAACTAEAGTESVAGSAPAPTDQANAFDAEQSKPAEESAAPTPPVTPLVRVPPADAPDDLFGPFPHPWKPKD